MIRTYSEGRSLTLNLTLMFIICQELKLRASLTLSSIGGNNPQLDNVNYTKNNSCQLIIHIFMRHIGNLPFRNETKYYMYTRRACVNESLCCFTLFNRYKRVLEGGIHLGMLTSVGKQQCYELGLNLKRRYMYKYKLLNPQVN